MKKNDTLIYIGESNDILDNGQEVTLCEDLSEAAKAGMHNTPELILLPCVYISLKVGKGIGGVKLIPMTELKTKDD